MEKYPVDKDGFVGTCGDFGGIRTTDGEPCNRRVRKPGQCHIHASKHREIIRTCAEHVPTKESKLLVLTLAAAGATGVRIAKVLDIPVSQVYAQYKFELTEGVENMNARVISTLFQMAVSGKNTAATLFWVKSRMGMTTEGPAAQLEKQRKKEKLEERYLVDASIIPQDRAKDVLADVEAKIIEMTRAAG